jgi:MFS family permease
MRIAGNASGVLVGLYLAHLVVQGAHFDATVAGALGAVSFGAELIAAIPMGMVSDALAPRALMTFGALLGGAATQLFGLTGELGIFYLSRSIEGVGAAAGLPALLAHLTDVTDRDPALRARVMSYFELTLLGGLALGGLLAGQLWGWLSTGAFAAVAGVYVLSSALLYFGSAGSRGYGVEQALTGFLRALREPSLRRLAPIWLCVNSIVGLWLGPTFTFLLTQSSRSRQFLDGFYAADPGRVGWVLFGYSLVFGAGVTAWSFVLPGVRVTRALRIALVALLGACVGLFLLNHSTDWSNAARWVIGVATAVCVMIESGFTPAALALLAGAVGAEAGRGAAMGIYSVLLSLGAILGSVVAGVLGAWASVDGLIYGTLAMAGIALALVPWLDRD